MKKCVKCNEIKELSNFYKDKRRTDGLVSYCKECYKQYNKHIYVRHPRVLLSPEIKLQRKKEYDKIHNKKVDWSKYNYMRKLYRLKFPEKHLAQVSALIIPSKDGQEKHHWSYNKEHWLDIIYLDKHTHRILHRHIIYDQERMMFRTTTGILLDSKESHLNYIDGLNKLDSSQNSN